MLLTNIVVIAFIFPPNASSLSRTETITDYETVAIPLVERGLYKCRTRDSNSEPTAYKAVALPIAPERHYSYLRAFNYEPTSLSILKNMIIFFNIGWIIRDSNSKPSGYEPDALTNCANDPYKPVTGVEPVPTAWRAVMLIHYTTRTGFVRFCN